MSRKIISMLMTIIYDNGDVEYQQLPLPDTTSNITMDVQTQMSDVADENIVDDNIEEIKGMLDDADVLTFEKVSRKILQQLMVLHFAVKYFGTENNTSEDEAIDKAISETSKRLNVTKQSIFDKLSRGIKRHYNVDDNTFLEAAISMGEFRDMTKVLLNNGDSPELHELMLKNVTTKGTIGAIKEKEVIDKFFNKPTIDFIYDNGKSGYNERF